MKYGINMETLRIEKIRKEKTKRRIHYYQWPNEEKQEFIKEGKYWYYNSALISRNPAYPHMKGETGCDTLSGAKGDVEYGGGKVWSETIFIHQ